ncbi:hypothetical protein KSS93_10985 [Pseudomonas xanthosomatis]|uniref:hypothetical protein n=1 Tax=Pseudomonas xanthosomatis TaxID=2842356 RepID=UPI001C3CDB98|nr:hypothetical protein [Pseudomonas xanthosomatis]QXH48400.1 hypothetical protein KSS93_10985 [Pseudomonas xanthosomatis]
MSNSMAQLLARMRQGPITLGWGAVAAYSRSRLNNLLEQQYLARLADNSYLPPFTQKLASDLPGDTIELQRLAFGAPLLSFSNASLSGSKALLRLNLVSGDIITTGQLVSSTVVTEAQGLWVELELDLETVTGEVDRYGRVTLNLAHGARFASNLFEHDSNLYPQLIKALETWMHRLPARYAVFELGTVDFSHYDELAPSRFIIRTQAAPGAKVRGALNHGDGAVLVFIQLRGLASSSNLPDDSFPYLIPDGDFSATLVLHKDLLGYASEQGLELLARLLFPQLNAFVKKQDHTPLDRALFGNIDPTKSRFTLTPALGAVIAAGQSLQFALHDGLGSPVTATAWHAVSPHSHTAAGHGSISAQGLYRAPWAGEMGREMVTVIVTAEYAMPGITYRAAARLHVTAEGLLVTPSAGAYRPQQQEQGLDVWNAGLGATAFELLEPRLGELAALDNKGARFVPHPHTRRRALAVQQVQASAGEQRDAALILANGQPLVGLAPSFVPSMAHGGTTQLNDINRIMPNQPRRWRVLAGPGSVSPSGLFQASSQKPSQSNVVACEVVHNGVLFATGYSVLKETSLAAVDTWKSLNLFTLTVGKSPSGTRGRVGPSGYQQLEVEITVETQAVDGKDYKLSVDEIASLRLFDRASGQQVPELADSEEGISLGEGPVWRTSRKRNRFVLANQSDPMPGAEPVPRGAEDRTIRQVLYLQRRGTSGSQVFYAGFQKDTGEWFYSNATSHINATIEVDVLTPEPFKNADYTLTRRRVDGGGGDAGGSDPEADDFDLHPVTEDYWLLDYREGTFYTAEFLKQSENSSDQTLNTSIARWESPYGNQTYHSYTGYIFQNHGQPKPTEVSFDSRMEDLLGRSDFKRSVKTQYEAGLLVIANYRNTNRRLDAVRGSQAYKNMSQPLLIRLRDHRANEHLIQIDYLPEGTIGDRNVLVHTVPSRPSAQGNATIVRFSDSEE